MPLDGEGGTAIVASRHGRQSHQLSSYIVSNGIDHLIEGQGEAVSGIGGGFLGRGEVPKPLPKPPSFPHFSAEREMGPAGRANALFPYSILAQGA